MEVNTFPKNSKITAPNVVYIYQRSRDRSYLTKRYLAFSLAMEVRSSATNFGTQRQGKLLEAGMLSFMKIIQ